MTTQKQFVDRAMPPRLPSARGAGGARDSGAGAPSYASLLAWLRDAQRAFARHWPEYLMEAAGLGLFMISACAFAVLLEYPGSGVHQAVPQPWLRRILIGVAMGLTAISIIYSPLGKRSGAHLNPAVTLTFLRLGKVEPWDAAFYMLAQFAGGALGVVLATLVVGQMLVADSAVNYVVTRRSSPSAMSCSSGRSSIPTRRTSPRS